MAEATRNAVKRSKPQRSPERLGLRSKRIHLMGEMNQKDGLKNGLSLIRNKYQESMDVPSDKENKQPNTPKRHQLSSPHARMLRSCSAPIISPPREGLDDLQEGTFILGAVLSGRDDVLRHALHKAPSRDVVLNLPIIVCMLDNTPFFYNRKKEELTALLNERAARDPDVAQAIEMMYRSGFSSACTAGVTDRGPPIRMNGDVVALFEALADDPEASKAGYEFLVPAHLLVRHPFLPHAGRIRKLVVQEIFNSNARPLHLLVECESPDADCKEALSDTFDKFNQFDHFDQSSESLDTRARCPQTRAPAPRARANALTPTAPRARDHLASTPPTGPASTLTPAAKIHPSSAMPCTHRAGKGSKPAPPRRAPPPTPPLVALLSSAASRPPPPPPPPDLNPPPMPSNPPPMPLNPPPPQHASDEPSHPSNPSNPSNPSQPRAVEATVAASPNPAPHRHHHRHASLPTITMSNLAMPCRRSPAKPDPTTPLCPSLVFKCGDNVRQDVGCLQSFRMFNQIWAEAGLVFNELPVHAHYYGVSPVGGQRNMGVFEYVAHCVPVKKVKRVTIMAGSRDRMVVSAAGSFIGAYVLGVRDRHYDNILVRDDGVLFHIDFSHLLGDQVTIDTDDFAITPDLKDWMSSSHWDAFLDLAVHAFCELRRRVSIIIPFICMMFEAMSRPAPEYLPAYCAPAGLYADDKAYIDSLAAKGGKNVKSQTEVEEFLRQAFMLHLDMETACTTLRKKLSQGPTRYKTRFKNAIHGIATAM